MPIPALRQWAIKVAVVFGLCVLLAMALPAALILAFVGPSYVKINVVFAVIVILLAAVAPYMSSLSNSGVKALLTAGPVALSLMMLIPLLGDVVLWAGRSVRPRAVVFGLLPTALIAVTVFSH